MAGNTFVLDLKRFESKFKRDVDTAVRRIAYLTFSRVIMRTPVDTGRARANWLPSTNRARLDTTKAIDPAGSGTLSLVAAAVNKAQAGDVLYLSNNLPYIRRLEYDGWSKQAPQGMVGVTMVEVQQIVREALSK